MKTDEELKAEFLAKKGATICPVSDRRYDRNKSSIVQYIALMNGAQIVKASSKESISKKTRHENRKAISSESVNRFTEIKK